MNNLLNANEARLNKALLSQVRINRVIYTLKLAIEMHVLTAPITFETPKVKWNRTKFNRMDGAEQAIYEAKMAEKKTVYGLKENEQTSSFYEVPKMVYEYVLNLSNNEKNNCKI